MSDFIRHCEARQRRGNLGGLLRRLCLLAMTITYSTQSFGYAFLCNGIDANGNQDSDNCGATCTSAPTKWAGNATSYRVDTSILFSGISTSQWTDLIVGEALMDWAAVPDAGLSITREQNSLRSFGDNTASHDIFWVTNNQEWLDKVGEPADTGILAVTLPVYTCPKAGETFRKIIDADMIVNGVASADYPWKPTCPSLSFSCQSVLATVAHESGHFLGLGHPCTNCPSLMSAIAEYLVEYPQLDDMQGIRALYPDGEPGAYTTVCSASQPCVSGLTCHVQSGTSYCSHACTQASDCQNHLVCSGGFCEFPNSSQLGAVGLHEKCSSNPCESGLLCVGVSSGDEYCFASCTSNPNACSALETCRQLRNSAGDTIAAKACIDIQQQGEACTGAVSCDRTQGLSCIAGTCQLQNPTGSLASEGGGSAVGNNGSSSTAGCSAVNTPVLAWIMLVLPWIRVPRRRKKC